MRRWRKGEGKGDAPAEAAGTEDEAPVEGARPVATVDPAADAPPAAAPAAPAPAAAPLSLPWPPLVDGINKVSLRPWGATPDDAVELARAWADPEVARWTAVPADHDEAAAARWIRGDEARRSTGTALDLVIVEYGAADHVLGEVGLVVVEPERRWAELGYWLAPQARGAGRAAIAVGLFAQWVLHDQPVDRLFARTDPANPASAAVAQRAGFTSVGTLADGPQVWVRDA